MFEFGYHCGFDPRQVEEMTLGEFDLFVSGFDQLNKKGRRG